MNLIKIEEKNWVDILKDEFEHPAIVLWRAVELRHIAKVLDNYDLGRPILDLGCAEGKIADVLFKGKKVIGLDNCWELIRQSQKPEVYQALILGDGCRMPYKNGVFSSVFSNCVIEHIPDIDNVLNEVSRVLKVRGIFLFTVPSHNFADFLLFSVLFNNLGFKFFAGWHKIKRNKLLNHFHCYGHKQWKNILRKNGLDLIAYQYYLTKKATLVWDFLTMAVYLLKIIWPLKYFLLKINKRLSNYLKTYYNMDSEIGSGLLLVAQKGA